MKRFSEQLHSKSQSVKLKAAERRELRERLVSYMEYHPLPAELKQKKTKSAKAPILHDAFTTVSLPFQTLFKGSLALAAFVLVVIPFAAERAVPGDTLYAVKVQFNEEVRSTLTFNSVQKVEWETTRLNRRIAEARLLESEGRLTEEVEAEVAAAVKQHTENAQKEIAVLREQDADEATIATIALDTTLEVQAASLKDKNVPQDDGEVVEEESLIATAIGESLQESQESQASTGTSTPAYDKLMARVELNTTRIYELRDSITGVVSDESLAEVTRRVQDLERTISEALETVSTDEEEARKLLVDALQRSQRLIVFMTELEVAATVDIEELVPVVLTPEEETATIEELTVSVTADRDLVVALTAEIIAEDQAPLVEKLELMVADIDTRIASMTAAETFAEAKVFGLEAEAIAENALTILEENGVTPAIAEFDELPIEDETGTSTATSSEETIEEDDSEEEPVEEEVTEEAENLEEEVVEEVEPETETPVETTQEEAEVTEDPQSEEVSESEESTTPVDTE